MSARSSAVVAAAGTALAAAVLLVTIVTSSALLGVVAVVIGAAALAALARADDPFDAATRVGADRLLTALRMLLTAAAVLATGTRIGAIAYALAAAVILGSWSVVTAAIVAALTRHPPCAVANLPGPRPAAVLRRPQRTARAALVVATVLDLMVAVTALLAGRGVTVVVASLAATVAVLAGLGAAVPALRAMRVAVRGLPELIAALEALQPQSVVHVSAGRRQGRYMLEPWLPALEALRLTTLIVVREPNQLAAMPPTSLPVVLARSGRELSQMVVGSLRVAFYLTNGELNGDLLREPLLRSVFLSHGDSDKAFSANPFNRVYHELWVAGQAAIDRYAAANVDLRDITIVGRPQLRDLPVGPRADGGVTTVLYAPTFEGYFEAANYTSLERMGTMLVRTLLEQRPDVRIMFKPHPSTGLHRAAMTAARRAVEDLLREAGRPHVLVHKRRAMSLHDAMAEADILITDVSGVATDFLWTERPLIATNPRGLGAERYATLFPTLACAYRLDPDGSGVVGLVDTALGTDPMREERLRVKEYVLDGVADPLSAFIDAADRSYDTAVRSAAKVRNTFTFDKDEALPPGSTH